MWQLLLDRESDGSVQLSQVKLVSLVHYFVIFVMCGLEREWHYVLGDGSSSARRQILLRGKIF